MPLLLLILLLIVIPAIELSVLIEVGEVVGSWGAVMLVLFTAVVGVSLVRSQGISTLMSVQQKLAAGISPGQEIGEGVMLALAGILLFLPGFVTDFIGLILLIPWSRKRIALFVFNRMQLKASVSTDFYHKSQGFNGENQQGDVFEGEFEHKAEQQPHLNDFSDKNRGE